MGLFAWTFNRRLLGTLFVVGFLIALAGNLVAGPRIGIGSAIAVGVMLALIPFAAALFAFARAIVELVLVLPLILLASFLRDVYMRWRRWQESAQFEQLIVRSYGPPQSH